VNRRTYAVALLLLAAGCSNGARQARPTQSPTPTPPVPASATPSPTPSAAPATTAPAGTTPPATRAATHPPTTSAPRATTSAPSAGLVTLTEQDSGRTVRVARGTTIVVRLDGGQVAPWSAADTSDGTVVRRTSATTGEGSSRATFRAVGDGTANLSAAAHPRCRDVRPSCGAPDRSWRVKVVVTG
jgi:hypothetical protein